MTDTTNDGAGLRPPADALRPSRPALPSQRVSGGPAAPGEVLVRLDASDESLDQVVAAAREAAARGACLRLVAAESVDAPGRAPVTRERLLHSLAAAAEMARTLCPGLTVLVTEPDDGPG